MNIKVCTLLLLMNAGICLASSAPEEKKDEDAMSAELQSDDRIANGIRQDILSASIEKGELDFAKALFRCNQIRDPLIREVTERHVVMWMLPALERAAQNQHAKIEYHEQSIENLKKIAIQDLKNKENNRCCIVQ